MSKKYLLAAIILITVFLRFWHLGSVPPSVSLDEASIGWNAYSLMKTGKDEYGTRLPLLLRAYDDFRPALYVYPVIPFVKLFGLSAVSVRLPSVFISLGVVFLTYLISRILFDGKKFSFLIKRHRIGVPEIAVIILSVSPWHIYLSRLGHEVNLGLFFVVLGTYFFVKYIYRDPIQTNLLFSVISFILSMYSYQSEKIITPLVIIGLLAVFHKQLLKYKKAFLLSFFTGLILSVPLIFITFNSRGLTRFRATSVASEDVRNKETLVKYSRAIENGNPLGRILYGPKFATFKSVVTNYISHFNPVWLFWGNSKENHKVPFLGLLYVWELPLIILGLYSLIKLDIDRKKWALILILIFTAPVPAAVTTQAPHAMRSYTLIPYIQILEAAGFMYLISRFQNVRVTGLLFAGLWLCVLLSVFVFYRNYFINFPLIHSESFQYALGSSTKYVSEAESKYQEIVFSNQGNLYQSYMFYLFYSIYDPEKYLSEGGTVSGGYNETHKFGKFEFRPVDWKEDKQKTNTLICGNPSDFPSDINIVKTFEYLDGTPGVLAVETL